MLAAAKEKNPGRASKLRSFTAFRMTEVFFGGVMGRLKVGSGTQRPRSAEYVMWGECGGARRREKERTGARCYEKIMTAGRLGICLGEKCVSPL